jgi:hypothetical protein
MPVVLFVCCEKEPYTVPVSVSMNIGLLPNGDNGVAIGGGCVSVGQIGFSGQRKLGGDVNFTTERGSSSVVRFGVGNPGFVNNFDIPQGDYYSMTWHISLSELDDDDYEEVIGDFDFDDPGLIFSGSYTNLTGNVIPLLVVVDESEKLVMPTVSSDEADFIFLNADKNYNASVVFDMNYVFAAVSRQSMENAVVDKEDDTSYIEISEDRNSDLYEKILFRLQKSVTVSLK